MFDAGEIADVRRGFDTQPRQQLIQRIARRIGRSYSYVEEHWTDDDLLRDVVWDQILLEDREKRCRQCGINPDEMFAPGGKPGREKLSASASWKFVERKCPFCSDAEEENWKAHNTDRMKVWKATPGVYMWLPRLEGEPVIQPPVVLGRDGVPDYDAWDREDAKVRADAGALASDVDDGPARTVGDPPAE